MNRERLERYLKKAEADLRAAATDHEESSDATLGERLAVLHHLAAREDILRECADLQIDLAEVVSAIAYARLVEKAAEYLQQRQHAERQRALGRLRIATLRAKRRKDHVHLKNLAALRETLEARPRGTQLLWAHVGLHQYMVKKHAYRSAKRRKRQQLDELTLTLLQAFGLSFAADVPALRRYRRLLISGHEGRPGRPRLFLQDAAPRRRHV